MRFRNQVGGALTKADSPEAIWVSSDAMKSRNERFKQKWMYEAKVKDLA